jgi:hypothetical protein
MDWWGQAEFSPGASALDLDLVLALALVVHHEHAKRKTNWTVTALPATIAPTS